MIARAIAACLLLVGAGTAAAAQPAPAPLELAVGARADATPFSFARAAGPRFNPPGTGPLFTKGYDGYVVQICDAALEALGRELPGLVVRAVPVTAATRFTSLSDTAPAADRIDILCDPATITDSRVKGRYASIPIYLSGISFAYPDPFPPGEKCASLLGAVAETTTETRGMQLILDQGKWPRYRARIAEALTAPRPDPDDPAATPAPVVASGVCNAPVIAWMDNHDALALAFCEGRVLYYVGDVEIIRSKLKYLNDKLLNENKSCSFGIDDSTYTDERYALFARVPAEADKAHAILRFFAILAEEIYTDNARSILIESYGRAFKDYRPSRRLQAFYWSLTGDTGTSE